MLFKYFYRDHHLGFKNITGSNKVHVFPNPAQNEITIRLGSEGYIEIRKLTGEILFNKKLAAPENTIDLNSFANGVYLINVQNRDGQPVATEKLLIQK